VTFFGFSAIVVGMGNPAGVKRDFAALERRRFRALRLLDKGHSEAEVARRVGVHRQSVNRWQQLATASGLESLRRAGRAGRKARLMAAQLGQLEKALQRGPEALGYETNLWTAARVADLIESEFGVTYHPSHVWRLLGQLGWSCQRPASRAIERDEAAIRRWKRVTWPALKKKPKKKGARSSSLTRAA